MPKRYIVQAKKIDPKSRDTYDDHAEDYLDIRGGEDEGESAAPLGEIVEYAVALNPAGEAAFRLASNLVSLEEVTTASADGFEAESVMEADRASVAGVGDIPTDEDTRYLKALWLRKKTKGEGVTIAVLDTGLGAPVAKMLRDMGILIGAYSYTGGNAAASATDHGSHVATTITPDGCRLLHYQVLGENGSGSSDKIISALYDAVKRGAKILNLSLSGGGPGDAYERAIAYARSRGALVLCATGNTGKQELRYPGACPSAVSVNAFDRTTDRPASFATSNSQVDFGSSGVNVLAFGGAGRLMKMSGSSMATPMLGWALAMLAAHTGKTGDALLQAMRAGARDTEAAAIFEGSGVASAHRASKKI